MDITEEILESLGIKIGHYTDSIGLTGTTVFVGEKPMTIGVDIRGSNPATFNVASLQPKLLSSQVNSVVMTGGTTYGLETCSGVMKELERQGVGFQTRAALIPGVVGAVIYDVAVGNSNNRPGREEGEIATRNTSYTNVAQGNIGVGTGATTGKWMNGSKLKGGFGMSYNLLNDMIIATFVVTNCVGDVANPKNGNFYSESGNYSLNNVSENLSEKDLSGLIELQSTNTTLVLIATNVDLDREQLMKVSELANDGLARSVYPVHTMMDGDTIFSVSSSSDKLITSGLPYSSTIDLIGTMAADTLQEAIKNSILSAESIEGFSSHKDKYK